MRIRVPASSANLGPGFDCFGLAWRLYDEIEFIPGGEGLRIEGCEARFQNGSNLAAHAFSRTMEKAGRKREGLTIRFRQAEIPVSRGLGSSAALIAAGVVAANGLADLGLSREELFTCAAEIEGHPDNIAPALFGGLTASAVLKSKTVSRRFPLCERLRFTALIPPFELSTDSAREVLPTMVPRQDAAANIARSALLLRALGDGDTELLAACLEDRLHQPYRFGLIRGSETARAAAEKCGAVGLCLSGAGSTLLCISDREDFSSRMAAAMRAQLPDWQVMPLLPDAEGIRILD